MPSGGVDVFYYVSNTNGAIEGNDFTPNNSFKVRLSASSKTFEIPVVDDSEYETAEEKFTLQLLPGQYKKDTQSQATFLIEDNETKIGIEKVLDPIEGGSAGTIKLISDRIPVAGQTITVNFQTQNVTASSGDYTLVPVTINALEWISESNGKYSKTVDILRAAKGTSNDDQQYDSNETLSVKLNGGTGYVIDSAKQNIINYTIKDNEPLISIEKLQDAIEGEKHGQYKIVFDQKPPQDFNLYLELPAIDTTVEAKATRGTIANTKEGSDYKLYYRYNANDPNEKKGFTANSNGESIAIDPSKLQQDANGKYFLTVIAEVVNDNLYEDNAKENLTIGLKDNVLNSEDSYAVDTSKQTLTTQIQDNEPKVSLGNVVHPSEGFGDGSTLVNLKSALKLTGKNYINVPENKSLDLSQTGQFTQEAWILPNATTDGSQGILGYQPKADNTKRYPGISLYNKTGINAGFGDGTNWNNFTVEKVLNPNQWNHVATTFDGNEYRLYVNGNLVYNTTEFKGKTPYQNQQLGIGAIASNVETDLTNPPGIITAFSATSPSPTGEEKEKAFDDQDSTKWLLFNKTGWLQHQFSGQKAHVVKRYVITSANDEPTRDPKDWVLQGSSDGTTWIDLDKQTSQAFTQRSQSKSFEVNNQTPYQYYRLNVTANNGASVLQLAELQLFGSAPQALTPFQGQIDEVRQWNVARTYEDIQDNLLKTLNGNEAGLVGYWQFNQNANDSSINQNHGTLQGGTGGDYLENPLPQIG